MLAKILRIVAILLLGLTAVVALLSGAGSTCVALGAEKYASMSALAPFKWLYVFYVLATLAASIYAIYATVELIKRKEKAYRDALIALAAILLLGVAQVVTSRALRGKSMPNDLRVYLSLLTLLVFLLLRIPRIWNQLGAGQPGSSGDLAAGVTLFLAGASLLTVQFWAGPTHTFGGFNFADIWHTPLAILGWILLGGGCLALAWDVTRPASRASQPSPNAAHI
jgi:hypothetical protein